MAPKAQFTEDMQLPPTADFRWAIDPEDRKAHLVPSRAIIGDGTPTLCNQASVTGLTIIISQYSRFAYQPCGRCGERGRKRIHAGVNGGGDG